MAPELQHVWSSEQLLLCKLFKDHIFVPNLLVCWTSDRRKQRTCHDVFPKNRPIKWSKTIRGLATAISPLQEQIIGSTRVSSEACEVKRGYSTYVARIQVATQRADVLVQVFIRRFATGSEHVGCQTTIGVGLVLIGPAQQEFGDQSA